MHLLFTSLGVSLYCSIIILSFNASGNFMSVSLTTMDSDLLLVNVYGPSRDSPECYDKLQDRVGGMGLSEVILGGDWNLVLDPNMS